jgi:hypothetical protein
MPSTGCLLKAASSLLQAAFPQRAGLNGPVRFFFMEARMNSIFKKAPAEISDPVLDRALKAARLQFCVRRGISIDSTEAQQFRAGFIAALGGLPAAIMGLAEPWIEGYESCLRLVCGLGEEALAA